MKVVQQVEPAAESKVSPALENLASQADAMGGAAEVPPGQVAVEKPPEPGNFEALCFLFAAFREVGSTVTKTESMKTTLQDRECETLGRVLAPLADKYGWNLAAYAGGPEGTALMTAGPILWAAWKALDAELSARRKHPEALAEPAAPVAA